MYSRLVPRAGYGCIPYLTMALGTFAIVFVILCAGLYMMLQEVKSEHPTEYGIFLNVVLGVKSTYDTVEAFGNYVLTGPGEELAKRIGVDPQVLARAKATEKAMDALKGYGSGDAALYIQLTGGESANCTNAGKCYALQEGRRFAGHEACLTNFLEVWKEHDIRAKNPIAAQYIPENYDINGIKGSCGAGALGCSQFMPCTGWIHHEELAKFDPSLDLWNPDTAMLAMALETYRLGWRKNLPVTTKVSKMLGWNNAPVWINGIVRGAEGIRGPIAAAGDVVAYKTTESQLSLIDNFQQGKGGELVYSALSLIGLGSAEAHGLSTMASIMGKDGWQMPVHRIPTKEGIPYPIMSSNAADHVSRGAEQAWDFTVPLGTPIYPVKAGTVVQQNCDNSAGYGCHVYITHGDGYMSYYAHMIKGSSKVTVGQEVTPETEIGQVGWTGKTNFGPHVHLAIRKNGVTVDPAEIYGSVDDLGLTYKKVAMATLTPKNPKPVAEQELEGDQTNLTPR